MGDCSTNLFVDLSPVVVALLTRTGNGVRHTGWMPGANTRHLPQAFVSLPRKLLCVPAARHTCSCSDPAMRMCRLLLKDREPIGT